LSEERAKANPDQIKKVQLKKFFEILAGEMGEQCFNYSIDSILSLKTITNLNVLLISIMVAQFLVIMA
jgi:hypothetical protein